MDGGEKVLVGGSVGGSVVVAEFWVLAREVEIAVEVLATVESSLDTYRGGGLMGDAVISC